MKVLVSSRNPPAEQDPGSGIEIIGSVDDLLKRSDFVSAEAPCAPQSLAEGDHRRGCCCCVVWRAWRRMIADVKALNGWLPCALVPTPMRVRAGRSIHCPLNAQTRHLIDAPKLKLMKPSAVLINTARGAAKTRHLLPLRLIPRGTLAAP